MISFAVVGTPAPQGSKRAFVNRHTGRVALVESAGERVRSWREDVRAAALEALTEPTRDPVHLRLEFRFSRPLGHYGTGRNQHLVRASAPEYPAGRPDLDKLVRATLDALTGIAFHDDAQVVHIYASKCYAGPHELPGARIGVIRCGAEVMA